MNHRETRGASLKPRRVAGNVLLFLVALPIAARVAAFQPASQSREPHAPLFSAFLFGEPLAPSAIQHLGSAVRDAIEARLAGRRAYTPISSMPPGLAFETRVAARRQQQFEAMLATLSGFPAAGKEAAAIAGEVRPSYEWEGFSDGPMREAASAEAYLGTHPKTLLAPALNLFILHRYRCAFEAATFNKDADVQRTSAARYRDARRRVGRVEDIVVSEVAREIDESPYLYLDTKLHPQTFKGARR